MADSLVMFQTVEHSDGNATIFSFPAIITARHMQALPVRDKTGGPTYDKKSGEQLYGPPVEVVSLTVFTEGGFEFYKDVVPWADECAQWPSSHTYRKFDSAAPKITLKKPPPVPPDQVDPYAGRQSKVQPEPNPTLQSFKPISSTQPTDPKATA